MRIKELLCVLLLAAAVTLTGCVRYVGEPQNDETTITADEKDSGFGIPDIAKKVINGGRESGKTTTVKAGEYVENTFFRFIVSDAELKFNVNGYCPNDVNYTHLRVNVTVESVYDELIPVGAYDFALVYTVDGDEVEIAPLDDDFTDGQFPQDINLFPKESCSGDVYFIVPYGIQSFKLKYVELYDDEFIGNTNIIEFIAPAEDETIGYPWDRQISY